MLHENSIAQVRLVNVSIFTMPPLNEAKSKLPQVANESLMQITPLKTLSVTFKYFMPRTVHK